MKVLEECGYAEVSEIADICFPDSQQGAKWNRCSLALGIEPPLPRSILHQLVATDVGIRLPYFL